jgi:hypothetical protein
MHSLSKEAAMGLVGQRLLVAVGGLPLVIVAALAARANESLGISEIRLASAEKPSEPAAEPQSTLEVTAEETTELDEPASPANFATAPPETPAAESQPVRPATIKPQFRRTRMSSAMMARGQSEPQVANNQIRQALNFYGGNPARATLSQFPVRTPLQSAPQQPIARQIKPFNTIYREPTISPYMNLYREEKDSEAAPNYFAFVRPQLDQIEANRAQHGEIQKLERQLQGRSRVPTTPQYQPSGATGRSGPARYMDTAQFYGGWSR